MLFAAWLIAWITAPALPLKVVAGAVGADPARVPARAAAAAHRHVQLHRLRAHGGARAQPVHARAARRSPRRGLRALELASPAEPLRAAVHRRCRCRSACCRCRSPTGCGRRSWSAARWARSRWWRGWRAATGASPQRALACAGLCPVTLAVGIGGLPQRHAGRSVRARRGRLSGEEQRRGPWTSPRRGAPAADLAAGALAVLAAGLKPSFAVVVPLIVLGAHRRWFAAAGAAAAGAGGGRDRAGGVRRRAARR